MYVTAKSGYRGGWTQIRIVVKMTDRVALKLFAKRFGGTVRLGANKSRKFPFRKPCYVWNLCGKKSVEALQVLSEYCLIKTAQLKLALEAVQLLYYKKPRVPQENMNRRIALAKEIARLKRIPVDDALGV